jgi:ferredoxin--NADP+ reductase
MIARVRPDFPRPAHRAGQYTSLGLGRWEPRLPGCQDEVRKPGDDSRLVRRTYSLSCSILGNRGELLELDQENWFEFYVVLVRATHDPAQAPGLTPRLFMLREGDRLQVGEQVGGSFTLEGISQGDTVVFLSTGTGEAPHNFMLWELLRSGHQGRILSACCVRYPHDLAYRPVHDRLTRAFANYAYVPLTTREPEQAGTKVYLQDLITSGRLEYELGAKLDPMNTHVFLCGNPAMIGVPAQDPATGVIGYPQPTGVIEILETRYGFRHDEPARGLRGNIHFEAYW